jgi:hypothetical protein
LHSNHRGCATIKVWGGISWIPTAISAPAKRRVDPFQQKHIGRQASASHAWTRYKNTTKLKDKGVWYGIVTHLKKQHDSRFFIAVIGLTLKRRQDNYACLQLIMSGTRREVRQMMASE